MDLAAHRAQEEETGGLSHVERAAEMQRPIIYIAVLVVVVVGIIVVLNARDALDVTSTFTDVYYDFGVRSGAREAGGVVVRRGWVGAPREGGRIFPRVFVQFHDGGMYLLPDLTEEAVQKRGFLRAIREDELPASVPVGTTVYTAGQADFAFHDGKLVLIQFNLSSGAKHPVGLRKTESSPLVLFPFDERSMKELFGEPKRMSDRKEVI